MPKTTIHVETETREKLKGLGMMEDTYDSVIKMLIDFYDRHYFVEAQHAIAKKGEICGAGLDVEGSYRRKRAQISRIPYVRRQKKIKETLLWLKGSPYPGQGRGDKKEIKAASKSAFRMRIGDYRAFYVIDNNIVKITELMTAEAAHKKYRMT